MTRIDFFFNVADKYRLIAMLGEKAMAEGQRVFVLAGDMRTAEELESVLWNYPPTAFLPHCRRTDKVAGETPLIIGWDADDLPHDDVLINLGQQQLPVFSRFRRLIELVGVEETDKQGARGRYRFYRDRGYEIRSTDASGGLVA